MIALPIRNSLSTAFFLLGISIVLGAGTHPNDDRTTHVTYNLRAVRALSTAKSDAPVQMFLKGADCVESNDPEIYVGGGSSSVAPDVVPTMLCNFLRVFHNMARHHYGQDDANDEALVFRAKCDDFDSLDSYLCPTDNHIADICAHTNPESTHAVKTSYCDAVFAPLMTVEVRDECIQMCIHYVSQGIGNCCEITCNN